LSPYTLACNLTEAPNARYYRAYAEEISGWGRYRATIYLACKSLDKYSAMDDGCRRLRRTSPS
jgi:hypothetical protein